MVKITIYIYIYNWSRSHMGRTHVSAHLIHSVRRRFCLTGVVLLIGMCATFLRLFIALFMTKIYHRNSCSIQSIVYLFLFFFRVRQQCLYWLLGEGGSVSTSCIIGLYTHRNTKDTSLDVMYCIILAYW